MIEALHRRHPNLKTSKPWLLALHYKDAEQWAEALEAGEAAATGALMRFDNLETLGYIQELKGRRGRTPTMGWFRERQLNGTRFARQSPDVYTRQDGCGGMAFVRTAIMRARPATVEPRSRE